ncbi:hypothetical protein O181_042676 [Austropuccinia psidii MF-1]|uniref:Uncharacterized protein n=1 Tax=Austropuccinia psidii MF-1 TaxID=1389203 RepID=A0A9Q3HFC1_9BASI|nr:hypothetical protein [Austropuccinia psidii MF-1]
MRNLNSNLNKDENFLIQDENNNHHHHHHHHQINLINNHHHQFNQQNSSSNLTNQNQSSNQNQNPNSNQNQNLNQNPNQIDENFTKLDDDNLNHSNGDHDSINNSINRISQSSSISSTSTSTSFHSGLDQIDLSDFDSNFNSSTSINLLNFNSNQPPQFDLVRSQTFIKKSNLTTNLTTNYHQNNPSLNQNNQNNPSLNQNIQNIQNIQNNHNLYSVSSNDIFNSNQNQNQITPIITTNLQTHQSSICSNQKSSLINYHHHSNQNFSSTHSDSILITPLIKNQSSSNLSSSSSSSKSSSSSSSKSLTSSSSLHQQQHHQPSINQSSSSSSNSSSPTLTPTPTSLKLPSPNLSLNLKLPLSSTITSSSSTSSKSSSSKSSKSLSPKSTSIISSPSKILSSSSTNISSNLYHNSSHSNPSNTSSSSLTSQNSLQNQSSHSFNHSNTIKTNLNLTQQTQSNSFPSHSSSHQSPLLEKSQNLSNLITNLIPPLSLSSSSSHSSNHQLSQDSILNHSNQSLPSISSLPPSSPSFNLDLALNSSPTSIRHQSSAENFPHRRSSRNINLFLSDCLTSNSSTSQPQLSSKSEPGSHLDALSSLSSSLSSSSSSISPFKQNSLPQSNPNSDPSSSRPQSMIAPSPDSSTGPLTPTAPSPTNSHSISKMTNSTTTSNGSNHTNSTPRQPCAKCGQSMTGQFVRALGTVYHLDCFRCQDCGKVVASKFFPVDQTQDGKSQYPLCETDYFRRLGLICAQCGGALRGSYITALDMKFHVEHFTCSVCPTVFGPQDSYYEHSGQVYCHFHYSVRFAVKCTGCRTAILKQFVEINRNNTDEHWHPECYMINKFWNIKLAPSPIKRKHILPSEINPSHSHDSISDTVSNPNHQSSSTPISNSIIKNSEPSEPLTNSSLDWKQQEINESAESLKEKQKQMEEQVYRIWTVLSTFEESSAACISEMLRHVSSGHYLEGVRMAGKFVLHVETLFAAIDDLDFLFRSKNAKEISHVREARLLCKKIVNFFSLLSHTHETGARKMSITQELLSLVTGLAHYLKILIRIALTSALKLERDHFDRTGIQQFLNRLDRLARDPDASKATPPQKLIQPTTSASSSQGPSNTQNSNSSLVNGKPKTYGYKSLTRAVGTLVGKGEATTDLCEGCKQTIEEECVRIGTSARWHTTCLRCSNCNRSPAKNDKIIESSHPIDNSTFNHSTSLQVNRFKLDLSTQREGTRLKTLHIYCEECARNLESSSGITFKDGFESVTRLEQYAFLLCVALNKLYSLLKQRGVLPASADDLNQTQLNGDERSLYDTYRNSSDIKRMKSVDLDRKLSATARLPQRSTVVESPSGRVAQASIESSNQTGNSQSTNLRVGDPVSRNGFNRSPVGPSRQLQDRIRSNPAVTSRERDYSNLPRSEPPPRPPPTHLNMIPPIVAASTTNISPTILSQSTYSNQIDPRPTLSRKLTAVKIVDEQPGPNELSINDEPRLGSVTSPVGRDTAGITLADLPRAMEAEQFREQCKPLPSQVVTLSELSPFESVIVKHVVALTLASENSPIRDETSLDELLEIIEARKGNFWGKLFKGGNDKTKVKKKGVFGVPLDVLIERHGVDSLLGAGTGQLRVPSFVDDCISAMKQMDMSVEGIFRKNGNIRRLKELTDAIDRDDGTVNFSDDNAVQLAALLKKFLRDLPDPLLTFKLYHLFIASQRVENDAARKRTLHLICCLLPKAHRDTMEVLFVFMKWVASFSHVDEETGSKMDLQNLATVITPNILYARSKDPTRDESFLAIRAVHELLENQDELFQVPNEVLTIMQDQELMNFNINEVTSKDLLKRVDGLLKSNQGKPKLQGKIGLDHYKNKGEVELQRHGLNPSLSHDFNSSIQTEQTSQLKSAITHFSNQTNGFNSNLTSNGLLSPLLGPNTMQQAQDSPFSIASPRLYPRDSPYQSPSQRNKITDQAPHPRSNPLPSTSTLNGHASISPNPPPTSMSYGTNGYHGIRNFC